jgi:ribosomal protein S17E
MIKEKIDQYLEFDSKKLFFDPMVRIFGGAVRDSIADEPINDIDILCGSKSVKRLNFILQSEGYQFIESLTTKDIASIYTDIHVICEPQTWVKGRKVIQVIRPAASHILAPQGTTIKDTKSFGTYYQMYQNLIYNVDISCCGVSYDGYHIYENYPDAVIHCLTKSFSVNSSAAMYSQKRIQNRIAKFIDRKWSQIPTTNLGIRRELVIQQILESKSLEYIPYEQPSTLDLDSRRI